jgi:hypothetical protein
MGMLDAGRKLLGGLIHAPGSVLVDGPSHAMGGHSKPTHGSHGSHDKHDSHGEHGSHSEKPVKKKHATSHANHSTLPLGAKIDMGIESVVKSVPLARQGKQMLNMTGAGNIAKAAGSGAAEAYLGHAAFDSGLTLGQRLGGALPFMGAEGYRTDADAEKELQRQGGQTFMQNLGENFLYEPGKGLDRLQTAVRKLPGDLYQMQKDAQKTKDMEFQQRARRGAAAMNKPEYGDNIRMLQGLMGNRQQY